MSPHHPTSFVIALAIAVVGIAAVAVWVWAGERNDRRNTAAKWREMRE